jgi:UDP-glucose 4-epimerase
VKKILVTGGAGYIGSHTLVELLANNFEPVVIDNLSNSSIESLKRVEMIAEKPIDFYKIDIRDISALENLFKKYNFSSVIHFAGLKSISESIENPIHYFKNNIEGSINLFSVMEKYNVNKIVFSSSATVYGNPSELPLKETSKKNPPANPYASSKEIIENILQHIFAFKNNWSIINLRYFNPVGAHESGIIGENPKGKPNNIMPVLCSVAQGEYPKILIFGNDYDTRDGTGVRDYIHVVDLAKAHINALYKVLSVQQIFNINLGTGNGYSVLELIEEFKKISGKRINYEFVSRRAGDIGTVYTDPSYAKSTLNWKAHRCLSDMCKDAWNWQKNNPKGYQ